MREKNVLFKIIFPFRFFIHFENNTFFLSKFWEFDKTTECRGWILENYIEPEFRTWDQRLNLGPRTKYHTLNKEKRDPASEPPHAQCSLYNITFKLF